MRMEFPVDCAGRFEPRKLLGEGGFGRVYLAEQRGLDRLVAVKVLRTETLQDDEQKQRFIAEGRMTARLSHPNVVRVIDAGAAEGVPWLVYELIEGPTLRERAARQQLSWREAVDATCSVASALEEAHRHEIVHRDVKAENVLETSDGDYKLADFGIAKWTQGDGVKTRTGFVVGTPTHLAPELIKGSTASPASDIYALGVMLFDLLTGRPPFEDEHLGKLMQGHLEGRVPTPTRLQPDMPAELDAILRRALEKNPEDRFASAGDFRNALRRLLERPAQSTEGTAPRALRQPREHTSRRDERRPTAGEPAPTPSPAIAGGLRARVIAGGVLALAIAVGAIIHLRTSPPAASPATPASPAPASAAPSEVPAISRADFDVRHSAVFKALETMRTEKEALRKAAAGDFTRQLALPTAALSKPFKKTLQLWCQLSRYLDQTRARTLFWPYLAVLLEDALRYLSDDMLGLRKELEAFRNELDVLRSVRPGDPPERASYARLVDLVIRTATESRKFERELALEFALAAELSLPPGDSLFDPAEQAWQRIVLSHSAFERGAHFAEKVGSLPDATLRDLFERLLRAVVSARELLSGPRGEWLAKMVWRPALSGVVHGVPFLDSGRISPEAFRPLVEVTSRMVVLAGRQEVGRDLDEQIKTVERALGKHGLPVLRLRPDVAP